MQNGIAYISETLKPYYPETEITGLSRIIMSHVTGLPYSAFMADRDKTITGEQQVKISQIVERLKKYEPIQYITGETEFYGLSFYVNRNTLIPRPETEELVELIINDNRHKGASVLDIGTGSGCIAIALARYMQQHAAVSAWDISEKALEMAQRNSERNAVSVNFSRVDVLNDYPADKKYDIIVSNPPYVLESEKADMHPNVLDFEPDTALFVPDNNALLFYKRIADIAKQLLNRPGTLYFEINRAKGQDTVKMLEEKGFSDIHLLKDISKRDRIVKATLK